MSERHTPITRTDVIRCENCGEDYSVTYKRCPFCDEAAGYSHPSHHSAKGGRRVSGTGGYSRGFNIFQLIGIVVPLSLIAAAIYIVVTVVSPLINIGQGGASANANETPAVTDTAEPPDTADATETPEVTDPPEPVVSSVTGITLSSTDFSLTTDGESHTLTAALTPSDVTDTVTWTSDNEGIATVSATGKVTATGNGTANITASVGDVSASCIVRCRNQAGTGTTIAANSGSYALSSTDFTCSVGEVVALKVTGTTDAVSWSTSNSSVATVSAGKVTAVASGSCTVTATVNGTALKCIVRVK